MTLDDLNGWKRSGERKCGFGCLKSWRWRWRGCDELDLVVEDRVRCTYFVEGRP
jgi:hypothetical protein